MVWQKVGVESVYEGTTILKNGGSTLRIMLLKSPFNFLLNSYTNTASIVAAELTNVATGYTSGVGGQVIASRTIVKAATFTTIDWADIIFTPLKLSSGTSTCVGAAIIDTSVVGGVVLCTAPFDVPVALDATTAKQLTVPVNDLNGLFGIAHGP